VGDAIPYPQRSLEVGEISKTENGMLIIGTGTCALQINLLQKPGGKMLSSTDFLRGYKMANGIILDFSPSISLLRASD
jgi:methionyl-tRNA formyltransferase